MRILDVDIYIVVYAVDEEASFKVAKSIIKKLQEMRRLSGKLQLLYLVGNKTDLVRSRQVTTQRGRRFAAVNGATFFEVSAAINHLVDELLVDMVVQWRKEVTQHEFSRLGLPTHPTITAASSDAGGVASSSASENRGRQSWTSTLSNPKNMLQRIFKQQFTAKSCMELQKS
ncbi:GTP-binding protein GEM [Echinococcus granulosus]|uniref:GTP-binding protein GEM n=1 Tax=Echinococcus granulosus TaxID=6210 RepID=W6UTS3_ECHGR|nr:GTP-binding protein GEM [Echinococcus granulosus]EUB64056.1 GTP-binding protein GEM [Echinococcus granulosus]